MGLFGFFNRSKFSKMSTQEKAREQAYAYLLCIEIAMQSNKVDLGNDKFSEEDLKILSAASESINIGSEYLDCDLRKSDFFAEKNNHFQEVLFSLDLKTKRSAIKQMLIVYSNKEKLENLLDENGFYILKGKFFTPIERVAYFMGINEEFEEIVKEMIIEINNLEFVDNQLYNLENDLTKLFSLKQRWAILEMIILIGSINKLSDEQDEFLIEITSDFQIDPDSDVSLTEFERSNLIKDLNIDQSNYILYLITEMLKLDVIFSLNNKDELISILLGYSINESIIDKVLLSDFIEQKTDEIIEDENDSGFYFDKGFEYYMLTEYDNALIYLNKAITIDQYNSKAYHTRGIVKVELKDYSGALNDLDIAIKLDSENFLVYRDRAELKSITNDCNEAINDFSMFIEKLQNDELAAPFYLKRGKLKFDIKDFQGAIEDSEKHINIRPDNIRGYELKGDCKFETNNFDEAINNYNIALENNIITNNGISGEIRLKEKLSKVNEVLKNINNSTDGFVKNEIDLITEKIKIELSELSDKSKGELYDYSYWFDVVCKRAESHSISIYGELNTENIIKLSDGHCEEYHYRLIENNDIEKVDFITPRIISFAIIYEKLLLINQSKLSSGDISKLDILKFHSISSLYGSIKFALEDITEGMKLVDNLYPDYIEELSSKSHNNNSENEREESFRLFSSKTRFLLNGLISNKIQESITQKNTSEYANLIKLVNEIIPVDNSNEFDKNIQTYDSVKAEIALFNNEQTLLFQKLFTVLIIYSKQFLYVDLLVYLIELINEFELKISEDLENDISEIEIVIGIVERLKAKFNIFNFVETLKSRLNSGIIQNEQELFEIIENEFSFNVFLEEDEKIIKATEGLDINIKRAIEMIGAAKMIKFDVDYIATILNEYDHNRFYGFDYIENYHTIYLSIYNCLIESSGRGLKME
jgi:tetratricopeptide (TPR) repeat protein